MQKGPFAVVETVVQANLLFQTKGHFLCDDQKRNYGPGSMGR